MSLAFIELNNVSLDIPIFDVNRSFRKKMLQICTGGKIIQDNNKTNNVSVRALEDISLHFKKGDRIGLVGHNGAGKSTLLRVLAGIYKPTSGNIRKEGKITSLFNIAVGLDAEDSGIENIKKMGAYLGMSPKEINAKREDIIEFSGLGDFIYLPVRTYSVGMQFRLSFSLVTALEPQILLLDEGLGVADAEFTKSANSRLEAFYNRLEVLVLASHSDDLIKQLCNKAVLLEQGSIKAVGAVDYIFDVYHRNKITC